MTMYRYFILLFFCLISTSWAGIQYPYVAEILEDRTPVFSEPTDEGYETSLLQRGDRVEVYQVQADGWCAVRPPIGSFSWVSGSYLHVGESNIGVVTVDKLASRIGSQQGDICRTVQIQLKKGERLVLLEKVETPENPSSPVWYKIVPPAGEFRWIRQESLSAPVPSKMPLSQGTPFDEEKKTSPSPQQSRVKQIPKPLPVQRTPQPVRQVAYQQPNVRQANAVVVPPEFPLSEFELEQRAPQTYSSPDHIQGRYQQALAQLNREVQAVMNRPVDDRTLEILIQKGESLIATAPSELDQTRASQLVTVLQKTRHIRQRNTIRRQTQGIGTQGILGGTQTGQHSGTAFSVPVVSSQPSSVQFSQNANFTNQSPFKASGRLGWFSQRPEGYPPFAVVNDQNQIVALITPEPGLDLQQYIDRQIGVDGKAGVYINGTERVPHVSASGIYPLR